ncbi:MAG: hypothetical protein ANABAC_1416 [Anaerolineae bacterium]|jgi:deazaflavin-dependent oxidoreductase (nitroreductase family)|nr:MAG: hypothetical protein ANABAC_1416 [Anaerolineae bacterium]
MDKPRRSSLAAYAFPSLSNALLYLVLTLLWSWAFLLIVVLRSGDATQTSTTFLRLLSGLGPFVVAVGMMRRVRDGEGLRSFFARSLSWRHAPKSILLLSLLLQPILAGLSLLTVGWLSGEFPSLVGTQRWLNDPLALLSLVVVTFFFGPLPEELGWRGYALPRLQSRWHPFLASLVLGLVWNLWHLPLFFIPGTYQAGLGFASPRFWIYSLNLFTHSILLTALINASGGATLTAILFHYMTNLCGEFLAVPLTVEMVWLGWTVVFALGLSLVWFLRSSTGIRLLRRLSSLSIVASLLARSLPHLDRGWFRLSGGKQTLTSLLADLPVVMVTTIGARSGQPRTTPLLPIVDPAQPNTIALIATNFGQERYPAWYFNLRKNPLATCLINGEQKPYLAREASGEEYERYWQLAENTFFGYRLYRQRIRNRSIPILLLEPLQNPPAEMD